MFKWISTWEIDVVMSVGAIMLLLGLLPAIGSSHAAGTFAGGAICICGAALLIYGVWRIIKEVTGA